MEKNCIFKVRNPSLSCELVELIITYLFLQEEWVPSQEIVIIKMNVIITVYVLYLSSVVISIFHDVMVIS